MGRYAEAEPLIKRALEIYEKTLGDEHPYVATGLANLAGLLHSLGKYAEAEPLFKRAIAIHERTQGPEHPNAAVSLNNLAKLLQDQGRYVEAEPLYRRALVIAEKTLGPRSSSRVAKILEHLAALCRATGRDDEAKELEQRIAAIRAG